jgi:hypothetical protein
MQCIRIFLELLKKTKVNLSQNSWSLDRGLKPRPPVHDEY